MIITNSKKAASIDLGTNTCLLLILEDQRVLHDETNVVRLGQGVDQNQALHPEAMERTAQCLEKYSRIVKSHGVDPSKVVAVATAQARDAKNAKDFFEKIRSQTGFHFRILSGDEEAAATFSGAALPGMEPARMVVMDIGGGSTEIVQKNSGKSVNIGAVRLTERYLKSNPVTDEEFWNCEAFIDAELEKMKGIISQDRSLVAVAGTAVTLAMIQAGLSEFNREKIDGIVLMRGDVHRIVEELKWRTVEERKKMRGMEPKRADVILAGALIFWRVMECLGFDRVIISTRGLRYGVLKLF